MFITRINKMFHKHGRIAFGLLTIVIIIPFVLYFSATPDDILNMFFMGGRKSNVSMNGKNISQKVLDKNNTNAMIAMALQGYQVDFGTMKDKQQVLQEALNRIRLLKIADERGIRVKDIQVVSYIRSLPLFQEKGQFSINMFNMFVQYFLGKYRLGNEDVENVARENLIIDILKKQIEDSVVVTDAGAKEFYNASHESYEVKVAEFKRSDYLTSVKTNDEELEKYFSANRNKYLIPAKYKADIIRFNFIDFDKEAAKKITSEQIDSYYLQNKALYKESDEKEAKEKIKKELIDKERNKLAKNKAQKFAVDVFKIIEQNDTKKASSLFKHSALKNKYIVYNITDWVDADTTLIPRLGKLPELVKAITHLYDDQPITNAVLDKNAYFVACLTDREAARKADFSEVKEQVKKDFVDEKALELAVSAAKVAATKTEAAIKDKKDLPANIEFKTFPAFSASNPMSIIKDENGYMVYQKAMQTKEGTVSPVADTPNGAMFIYVEKISLPTKEEFEKQKSENLVSYKKAVQETGWNNFLLMLEQNSNTVINNQ